MNLFTRPRRFGKSLNMSMLRAFFEIGSNAAMFDGLAISEEKDLCEAYMGKFPVISISLKNVGGLTYEEKESIFTGLNNIKVLSVTDVRFDEYFGFTDEDVKKMLEYYGFADHYETVKEWYDGYRFGNADIYCPWDVISYCDQLCADPDALPEDYWSNTSSNSIVRRFIDKADRRTRDEIERLIAGEEIVKEIYQDLTYNELYKTIDHLRSILFTTGYLTHWGRSSRTEYRLAIPNREIRKWFWESAEADAPKLDALCRAFGEGDAQRIEKLLNEYLWDTISIRDTAVQKECKENFYHGILLGLLRHEENWLVRSNAESGEGYGDILIEISETRTDVVIELKYAENGRLEDACEWALEQIQEKRYESCLIGDGMQLVICNRQIFLRIS